MSRTIMPAGATGPYPSPTTKAAMTHGKSKAAHAAKPRATHPSTKQAHAGAHAVAKPAAKGGPAKPHQAAAHPKATGSKQARTGVRMMTWNIRYASGSNGGNDDPKGHNPKVQKMIAAKINKANPDVVVLQEDDNAPGAKPKSTDLNKIAKMVHASGFHYFYNNTMAHKSSIGVPGQVNGKAIIVRNGYHLGKESTVGVKGAPHLITRSAVKAPSGARFTMMGLHLTPPDHDPGGKQRDKQLKEVGNAVDQVRQGSDGLPKTVLMGGDFNMNVHKRDAVLDPSSHHLQEAFGAVGVPEFSQQRDSFRTGAAIDGAYVTNDVGVNDIRVDSDGHAPFRPGHPVHQEIASDHDPLVADVSVPNSGN